MIAGNQRVGELSPEGMSVAVGRCDEAVDALFGHKIDSVSRYGSALAIGWLNRRPYIILLIVFPPLPLPDHFPLLHDQATLTISFLFLSFLASLLPSCPPTCVDFTVDHNPAVSEIHFFFPFVPYAPPSHCHDRQFPLWMSIPPFKKTCRRIPKVPLPLFFTFLSFFPDHNSNYLRNARNVRSPYHFYFSVPSQLVC